MYVCTLCVCMYELQTLQYLPALTWSSADDNIWSDGKELCDYTMDSEVNARSWKDKCRF
jgi:hypothetical protein